MSSTQRPLPVIRRAGSEVFHKGGVRLGFGLIGFWEWVLSDLVSNTARGLLAEYIVACALGIEKQGVRTEWGTFDLESPAGTTIEVKSAAYVQAWSQDQGSRIRFRVPKTRSWNPSTHSYSAESKRWADVYVFALLHQEDRETIDPLNVEQWSFYVVATSKLDGDVAEQESVGLAQVERLAGASVSFEGLIKAVESARPRIG